MLRALLVVAIFGSSAAHAESDLCAPGTIHHGRAIDLDVQAADLHDVLRLLADIGHANLVVSDEVAGKVTVKLRRVAWDAAACAIAQVHHLRIMRDGNILVVRRADSR